MTAWEHIEIPSGGIGLFCNAYITNKTAMNIIVTHTPIVSTLDVQPAYEPLAKYDVNIFAFDFSGTGKSGGEPKNLSRMSIIEDLDAVAAYIESNFSANIHLYGNTGIGGMLAQYYAASSTKIKSFAQFACINYKDTAGGLGYPYPIVKALCFILGLLPEMRFPLKPPKYKGPRHEEDDSVYKTLTERHPDVFKANTKMLKTLMECFVAKDSAIKNSVTMPTLVFKVPHDRYFPPRYFDSYFQSLTCEKKLVEVENGVHNSYYLDSELFCGHAYEWFAQHSIGDR
ncbi:MAG: alpha/beta hydrolase [Clostridiales bacterium]|jgi:pimeloyl-ACP methyl ester carboxylesterase|nr:alpha/beta hydrolase [Clostridiales bacterium]